MEEKMADIYDLKRYVQELREDYGYTDDDAEEVVEKCIEHFGSEAEDFSKPDGKQYEAAVHLCDEHLLPVNHGDGGRTAAAGYWYALF